MSQKSEEIECRQAGGDDETDILDGLEEVVPEIPVRLDGQERQEKIKIVIRQCQASGKSLVAVMGRAKSSGLFWQGQTQMMQKLQSS